MAKRRTGVEAGERFRFGDKVASALLESALLADSEDTRLTHGWHTYPAGLHPDAARDVIAHFGGPRILDPFCGGGTTMVEARAQGFTAIGRDVSPIALRVATARTSSPPPEHVTKFRSRARKLTAIAQHAEEWPPEHIYHPAEAWYEPHAIQELESLRTGILESDEDIQPLLWAAFSSLLIKVSWRASDTSARRQKHRRPAGTTSVLFHKKVRELGRRMEALREVVPEGTPDADIQYGDARKIRVDGKVNLVITSPPYPSTYDYLPLQHLRMVWLPDEKTELSAEIGPRRDWKEGEKDAAKRWRKDTNDWTKQVSQVLEPGGHFVCIIGDGLTPSGTIDTARATEEAGKATGLELIARASVERPDHARNTIRWEHAIAFRKN